MRLTGIVLPILASIAISTVACAPKTAVRGSIPTKDQIALVTPGVHGQEDVKTILGSPSVISTFDDSTWYYIGRHTKQWAFFKTKTIEQQVLIIRYDANGTVDRISRLDKKDGREIELVERETPSAGKKLGILEQLFGNIGRFGAQGTEE